MALVGLSPTSNMEPDLDVKTGTNLGTKLGCAPGRVGYIWAGGLSPLTNMGAVAGTLASEGLIWQAVIFCLPTDNFSSRVRKQPCNIFQFKHSDENILSL